MFTLNHELTVCSAVLQTGSRLFFINVKLMQKSPKQQLCDPSLDIPKQLSPEDLLMGSVSATIFFKQSEMIIPVS